ncbi:N-acyl homoserine lactonase family protein [Sphingomonas parva]|uniref:N-acyl homoserine lactonase family protein n=1 Tax=Sphingomonas parva TaxID=2555898 RepID=A0A4Y8ZRR5_9SPHN|nr:N-acyl homoserine lactonase family protein [Sphingomonas parva]TFI58693.1 N-acyl homoserine lactonase family protein [Sphingomonas parva]
MKTLLAVAAIAVAAVTFGPAAAQPAAPIQMWRLDCGEIQVSNLDVFSDTFAYVGQKKTLTDSCYLIRHGENYLLWDSGLPGELAGKTAPPSGPFTMSLKARVTDQLARIGVRPEQVNFVGISHNHDDHLGQAADFPKATLLIGSEDYEATAKGPSAARLAPWIKGGTKVEKIDRDHDVFGDGSVVILDMPGHTHGHQSLLVRLPRTGPVLLTGDLYHFTENMRRHGMPSFNVDRSDTLGSFDRFDTIARNLKARVIIQHEPDDVAKLPAFPQAAN